MWTKHQPDERIDGEVVRPRGFDRVTSCRREPVEKVSPAPAQTAASACFARSASGIHTATHNSRASRDARADFSQMPTAGESRPVRRYEAGWCSRAMLAGQCERRARVTG